MRASERRRVKRAVRYGEYEKRRCMGCGTRGAYRLLSKSRKLECVVCARQFDLDPGGKP